jgi:hypothetical protein
MENACKVFDKILLHDVVTWNADIWIYEMWARTEGTGTILTNAT